MKTESETLTSIAKSLTELSQGYGRFEEGYTNTPCHDSIADKEYRDLSNGQSIASAFSLGSLAISYSEEHLSAFARLSTDTDYSMAPFTCIRSMLEIAAVGAWLLDPNISTFERIGRVFARRFKNMAEQLNVAKLQGLENAAVMKLEARMRELAANSIRLGYLQIGKKNQPTGAGVPHPGPTKLIKDILDAELAYSLLSALAHGQSWAITGFGFVESKQTTPILTEPTGQFIVLEKRAKPESLVFACQQGVLAFARLTWNKSKYFGWNWLRYEEVLESVADRIDIKDSVRFWRS